MIEIQLYRMRIGGYSARRCKQRCTGSSILVLLPQIFMQLLTLMLTCILFISLGALTLTVALGVPYDFSSTFIPYAYYSFICENHLFVNPFLLLPAIFTYYITKLVYLSHFSKSIHSCISNRIHRDKRCI